MRIAIISDVHGNIHAFEKVKTAVVAEAVDEVVFLGDIAFFGLYPQECFDMLQILSPSICIKGNTDSNIENLDQFVPSNEFEKSILEMCYFMESRLNTQAKSEIASWKIAENVDQNEIRLIVCHGSPYSFKDQLTEENAHSFQKRILAEAADYVFCGHTHQPARFQIGETQVINCGPIGYSFDGDTSARYGLLNVTESGQVEVETKQVEYDIEGYKRELKRVNPPFIEGLLYSLEYAKPKSFK